MVILFITSQANPLLGGGTEVMVWEQINALTLHGHRCILLTTTNKRGIHYHIKSNVKIWEVGIKNVYWPFDGKNHNAIFKTLWHSIDSFNIWMQTYINFVVKKENPDIASVHNLSCWSAATWTTLRKLNIPIVQTLHDFYHICTKTTMYSNTKNCKSQCKKCHIFRLPHRNLSQKIQGVVGVSEFIIKRHQDLGYFNKIPIKRTIHNCRSIESLKINADYLENNRDHIQFGFIGRLAPSKGLNYLINTFNSMKFENASLIIAGSGKDRYNEDYLNKIKFLGRITPSEFYPQVDVVIVPSLWEDNFPSVIIEALAFGKPVIASRRGGIPEMIRDGENGLLFEPDSPGELESAIKAMCDDNLRAKLTAKARPSSLPFTDIDRWVSTYEALYQEVIAAHKRNPLI